MSKVFIIAEAACTWLPSLETAYRSIRAAKACGADAWKTQWTSDPEAMAMRRGVDRDRYTRLAWSADALPLLKGECERVGIEFMCTVFLPKDVLTINRYVDRFKISAFESTDIELQHECLKVSAFKKPIIVSRNDPDTFKTDLPYPDMSILWCVSKYPTPIDEVRLCNMKAPRHGMLFQRFDGLSDHTTSVLTGAVAVGAGARIIEKHVRLADTPKEDPDYGHSLLLDCGSLDPQGDWGCEGCTKGFHRYVDNVREAERML